MLQVAASRGVSDSQQLQDNIQHFFTHDLSPTPGLLCTPAPASPLHPHPPLLHVPDTDWETCGSQHHTALIPENVIFCNSTKLGYGTGRGVGGVICGVVSTPGVGGIHQVKKGDIQPSEEFVLPDLSCPPPTHGNRSNFFVGVQTRMVSSPSVQPSITVTRGDKNKNIVDGSYATTKGSGKSGSNSQLNHSNNNHKNKGTGTKRPPEPDSGTDRSDGELPPPSLKYDIEVCKSGEECRHSRQKQPLSSQAVNAKEVEKLLQDALWKGTQNEEKRYDY